MKYSLKYQGNVNDKEVFTVIVDDERGLNQAGVDFRYLHYVADGNLNIKKVSHMDTYITACNTIEHTRGGPVVQSKSNLVTVSQTQALIDTLIAGDVELEGIGKISGIDLRIIKNYLMEISYGSHVNYKYFDGEDLESAFRKARFNNLAALGITLYGGDKTVVR